ncbi:MAG: PqqD family protein [Brevundimonas sp.]|uniref:PqqD family protein n=1 Tax=Brevundimonas sp. TaxID=1871086 RepID=UPI002743B754|nr:PqqD family protein [Brevundimonas sp.]MDP3401766.1 PqqD family protein [Brevundimonas sp.]MDZ4113550.1 PqqD family protein [Brevundimonas sp.]
MPTWKRREDWVGTEVEDHLVMLHLESGRYVALNDTAAEAWRLLETPQDDASLVEALTEVFAVDADRCKESVTTLLTRMVGLELVEPVA